MGNLILNKQISKQLTQMNFKNITIPTLALFLSGADARGTKLNELRNMASSASKASQPKILSEKITNNDSSISEQNEFIDIVQIAQLAFKNLSEKEIHEIIIENPEL